MCMGAKSKLLEATEWGLFVGLFVMGFLSTAPTGPRSKHQHTRIIYNTHERVLMYVLG